MGSSCRYIGVRVSMIRRNGGGSIIAISLSVLFSVVGIGVLTTVDVGRSSGMVYIPVSVGSSYRYIGVRVSIIRRDMGWGIGWGIRTISLSVLFSVVGIGVLTTVHVGGGGGMVYISVSMGSSYRYIGVRVSIIRRDRGRSIIAISLSALFSIVGLGVLTTVHVGGGSGMVHVPVSVGGNYRYIGVRVSRVRIGRIH